MGGTKPPEFWLEYQVMKNLMPFKCVGADLVAPLPKRIEPAEPLVPTARQVARRGGRGKLVSRRNQPRMVALSLRTHLRHRSVGMTYVSGARVGADQQTTAGVPAYVPRQAYRL